MSLNQRQSSCAHRSAMYTQRSYQICSNIIWQMTRPLRLAPTESRLKPLYTLPHKTQDTLRSLERVPNCRVCVCWVRYLFFAVHLTNSCGYLSGTSSEQQSKQCLLFCNYCESRWLKITRHPAAKAFLSTAAHEACMSHDHRYECEAKSRKSIMIRFDGRHPHAKCMHRKLAKKRKWSERTRASNAFAFVVCRTS